MTTRSSVQPGTPAPQRTHGGVLATWQRRPAGERRLIVGGTGLAIVLLAALAITCQASVHKGERFRAEQRLVVAATPAAKAL